MGPSLCVLVPLVVCLLGVVMCCYRCKCCRRESWRCCWHRSGGAGCILCRFCRGRFCGCCADRALRSPDTTPHFWIVVVEPWHILSLVKLHASAHAPARSAVDHVAA